MLHIGTKYSDTYTKPYKRLPLTSRSAVRDFQILGPTLEEIKAPCTYIVCYLNVCIYIYIYKIATLQVQSRYHTTYRRPGCVFCCGPFLLVPRVTGF